VERALSGGAGGKSVTVAAASKLLLLVRHAACDRSGVPSGDRFDPPLTENGRAQAEALAARLADVEIGGCLSSPLRRARETAEALTAALRPRPCIEIVDDLAEYHRGDFEHLPLGDLPDRDYASAWRDGNWERWPNGETRAGFRARADAAAEKLRHHAAASILVVTHGGVINELLLSLLEIDGGTRTVFEPGPSSVTLVQLTGDAARVLLFADVWHLDDALPVLSAHVAADGRGRASPPAREGR
jgi:probable phosphoglycerate mutase